LVRFHKIAASILVQHKLLAYGLYPPRKFIQLPTEHTEFLGFFDNNTMENVIRPLMGSDEFDDRLVMYFPPTQWTTHDPLTFQPSKSAQLLLEIMQAFVRWKLENKTTNTNICATN